MDKIIYVHTGLEIGSLLPHLQEEMYRLWGGEPNLEVFGLQRIKAKPEDSKSETT